MLSTAWTFSLIWLFIFFPVLVAAASTGCQALARLLRRTSGPFRTIVHRRRLAAVADVDNRPRVLRAAQWESPSLDAAA
jgi:hypothetical protein